MTSPHPVSSTFSTLAIGLALLSGCGDKYEQNETSHAQTDAQEACKTQSDKAFQTQLDETADIILTLNTDLKHLRTALNATPDQTDAQEEIIRLENAREEAHYTRKTILWNRDAGARRCNENTL